MNNYKTRFEAAAAKAMSDLTEHERHLANMFYSTYIATGLSDQKAKCGSLVEIYRERALRASNGGLSSDFGSVDTARRWHSDLIMAMPGNSDWSAQQRFSRPAEFAAAMRSLSASELANITQALDTAVLSDSGFGAGFVVVAASRAEPESVWAEYFTDRKPIAQPTTNKQKRVEKKKTKKRITDLTPGADDLFG